MHEGLGFQLREIPRSEWAILPIQEVAPDAQGANTSAPETAPWRAGPSGLTSAGRHGTGAQTRLVALVQDVRTASATRNQNNESGTSARLGAIAGVWSNLHFRYIPSYRSSRGSLCKSSRLSHGRPSRDVGHSFRLMLRGTFARPQHLGSGTSSCDPPISAPAKPWKVDAQGPVLANTTGSVTLRNGTDGATAAVVSAEHKVASVSTNKQLSTSHQFPAIISPRFFMHASHNFNVFKLFKVQLPSNTGGLLLPLRMMSAWAPPHFSMHAACRGVQAPCRSVAGGRTALRMGQQSRPVSSSSRRTPKKRVSEQGSSAHDAPSSATEKTAGVGNTRLQPAVPAVGRRSQAEWEQIGPTLVEPGNAAVKTEGLGDKRPRKPGPGDRRPVPPKRSVLQPGGVTLAAMASRSVAMQTEDSVSGSLTLFDWLTPATVTSTATQTLDDGRSLHQWRSIQGQHGGGAEGPAKHQVCHPLAAVRWAFVGIQKKLCALPWRVRGKAAPKKKRQARRRNWVRRRF